MTPTHPDFSQLLPALQQVGVALTLVMGALLVAIKALDYLTRMLLTFAPQNRALLVLDHWFSFLAMRWPVTPVPPAPGTTLTTSTVVSTPPAPVLTVTPAPPPANPAPAPAAPTATGGAGLLVLACLLGLSLTACAHMTPLEGKLLSCGEQGGASVISAEGPVAINAALSSTDPQWQTAPILAAGLDTTICAIVAIFNSLTQPTASGALPALTPTDQVRLIHARELLLQWGVVNANGQVRRGVVAPK